MFVYSEECSPPPNISQPAIRLPPSIPVEYRDDPLVPGGVYYTYSKYMFVHIPICV